MSELSLWRLYLLRAGYLVVALGLALTIWPGFIHHDKPWGSMQGVVNCVLAGVSLMAILGLRYPLRMLPLLFFEFTWKSIWLLVVAVPLWSAHAMDENTWATASACLMGVIFPIVIPWDYVVKTYVSSPGDRWH